MVERERVRSEIVLTSPSGQVFTALWAGGTRSVDKRLAQYSYAAINGQVVDDYGSEGLVYPTNIIFDGNDYDIQAKRFFEAFAFESGKWEIIHPTEGAIGLQGVRAREHDQPVDSYGSTRVDIEWLEYVDPGTLKTLRNYLLELGIEVNAFNVAQSEKFQAEMLTDAASVQEAAEASRSVFASVKAGYKSVVDGVASANDRRNDFIDTLNSGVVTAAGIVGGIQDMIAAPGRALTDLRARIRIMKNILTSLFGGDFDTPYPSYNDAQVKEVAASAVAAAVAEAVTSATSGAESGLPSRAALLEAEAEVNEIFESIRTGLDREATFFTDEVQELRYAPLREMALLLAGIEALARQALRRQFFDLPTEITYRVPYDMVPVDVVRLHFGELGEADARYLRFLEVNDLQGLDIICLPPGKTVKLYGENSAG